MYRTGNIGNSHEPILYVIHQKPLILNLFALSFRPFLFLIPFIYAIKQIKEANKAALCFECFLIGKVFSAQFFIELLVYSFKHKYPETITVSGYYRSIFHFPPYSSFILLKFFHSSLRVWSLCQFQLLLVQEIYQCGFLF